MAPSHVRLDVDPRGGGVNLLYIQEFGGNQTRWLMWKEEAYLLTL